MKRNLHMNHINTTLREQLDQATIANHKLSQEIQKVNHEWSRLREQLECREEEWRTEEKSFNDYFGQEHAKLLELWRSVVSFRREFTDIKQLTDRDMRKLKSELNSTSIDLQKACLNLNNNISSNDDHNMVRLLVLFINFNKYFVHFNLII
jgi:rootletin